MSRGVPSWIPQFHVYCYTLADCKTDGTNLEVKSEAKYGPTDAHSTVCKNTVEGVKSFKYSSVGACKNFANALALDSESQVVSVEEAEAELAMDAAELDAETEAEAAMLAADEGLAIDFEAC
eukprot:tig00000042_g15415.t1